MEEHSDGMMEAQHFESPELVLAPATTRTRRQANRAFAVGIRSRTPFGKSASIVSGSLNTYSGTCTVTGRNAGGAATAG